MKTRCMDRNDVDMYVKDKTDEKLYSTHVIILLFTHHAYLIHLAKYICSLYIKCIDFYQ